MSAAMDLLLPFLLAWAITTCQVPQPTQDQELAISSLLYYCICATFHPMKASINQSNYEERKDNFTLEKLLLRSASDFSTAPGNWKSFNRCRDNFCFWQFLVSNLGLSSQNSLLFWGNPNVSPISSPFTPFTLSEEYAMHHAAKPQI